MASNKLTTEQAADFARLENVVREGLQTFVDVGNALMEIRDRRLYRDVCATFESYVQIRFQFSRAHAYRHIEAAKTAGLLSPSGDIPTSEAVARPLTTLPPEQQGEAWEEARESARAEGKATPTRRHTTAAVAARRKDREREAQQNPAPQAVAAVPARPSAVSEAETDDAGVAAPLAASNDSGPHEGTPDASAGTDPAVKEASDTNGDVSASVSPVPELGTQDSGSSLTSEATEVRAAVEGGGVVEEAASLPENVSLALSIAHTPLTRVQLLALDDAGEARLLALGHWCQTVVAARRRARQSAAA